MTIEDYMNSDDMEMVQLGIQLVMVSLPREEWLTEIFKYFAPIDFYQSEGKALLREDYILIRRLEIYKLTIDKNNITIYKIISNDTA